MILLTTTKKLVLAFYIFFVPIDDIAEQCHSDSAYYAQTLSDINKKNKNLNIKLELIWLEPGSKNRNKKNMLETLDRIALDKTKRRSIFIINSHGKRLLRNNKYSYHFTINNTLAELKIPNSISIQEIYRKINIINQYGPTYTLFNTCNTHVLENEIQDILGDGVDIRQIKYLSKIYVRAFKYIQKSKSKVSNSFLSTANKIFEKEWFQNERNWENPNLENIKENERLIYVKSNDYNLEKNQLNQKYFYKVNATENLYERFMDEFSSNQVSSFLVQNEDSLFNDKKLIPWKNCSIFYALGETALGSSRGSDVRRALNMVLKDIPQEKPYNPLTSTSFKYYFGSESKFKEYLEIINSEIYSPEVYEHCPNKTLKDDDIWFKH